MARKTVKVEEKSGLVAYYPVQGELEFAESIVERANATIDNVAHVGEVEIWMGHYSEAHSSWIIKYRVPHPRAIDYLYRHLEQCEIHCEG